MLSLRPRSLPALIISITLIFSSFSSVTSQAAMVSTHDAITQTSISYDRAQLSEALNQEGVRAQLLDLGVDPIQIEKRINSLTADELSQLNQSLSDAPAGQGVVGVLLTLFIVFVVTDMLCATDIFSFVKCINR